jgi:uncharacterized protein (DUF433 family)
MDYTQIITLESGKRDGKPCIRGLRITVYDVLEYLASGMTRFSRIFPTCAARISALACNSRLTASGA